MIGGINSNINAGFAYHEEIPIIYLQNIMFDIIFYSIILWILSYSSITFIIQLIGDISSM